MPSCAISNNWLNKNYNFTNTKYKAIVLGKMTKKKVKKSNNYYFTEYKLKPENWIFRDHSVKKSKFIKVKIFGAELPKKGIVIRASTSPEYVPMNREAIFFLENTKRKEKEVFTISRHGIIYGEALKRLELEFATKEEKT